MWNIRYDEIINENEAREDGKEGDKEIWVGLFTELQFGK